MKYIIRFFFKGVATMPFGFIYLLSDLFFFIVYHIAGYRRKVVDTNLNNSFPQFTNQELAGIRKSFYKNLVDFSFETIKLLKISSKDLKQRCEVIYSADFQKFISETKPALVLTGHNMNWEWAGAVVGLHTANRPFNVVYLRLSSNTFNDLMYEARSRFGNLPVHMEQTLRHIVKNLDNNIVSCFLADQTPQKHQIGYWTRFLNQKTAFYSGPEKIAIRLNIPTYFAWTERVGRGRYKIHFKEIAPENSTGFNENELMEKYTRLLEEVIIAQPSNWLWSHRRWKHNKP